jgi:3-isopropylmalate dehydratase small subunit
MRNRRGLKPYTMDIRQQVKHYTMDIRDSKYAYSLFVSEIQHARSEVLGRNFGGGSSREEVMMHGEL